MSIETHRQREDLGGVVYLLEISMEGVTGNPSHVRRFTNNYGIDGTGVVYQGNTYEPYPYLIKQVKKNQKANNSGAKLSIGDNEDYYFTRFVDSVGGNLQGARVKEIKVYGRYLDTGEEPNVMAYSKRIDHIVSYTEDSNNVGELIIHTTDPLSKDLKVPSITFSAGIANSGEVGINIFPAVDRSINKDR